MIAAGNLRQRVSICGWTDTPAGDVDVDRQRPVIFTAHAEVKVLKALRVIQFQVDYGDERAPTHQITIRRPADTLITDRHWVFQWVRWQGRSVKRWYRVFATDEMEPVWLRIMAAQQEFKDDRAFTPQTAQPPNFETPRGIEAFEPQGIAKHLWKR